MPRRGSPRLPDRDTDERLTRRQVLTALAGLGCVAALDACRSPAADGGGAPHGGAARSPRFTGDKHAVLFAAVETVLPGAAQAGALEFFERLFEHRAYRGVGRQFDQGAVALGRLALERHRRAFTACSAAERQALLLSLKRGQAPGRLDGPTFVRRLVVLTVESYFGDPRHGGNHGEPGWKLAGRAPCHFVPRRLELVVDPERGRQD